MSNDEKINLILAIVLVTLVLMFVHIMGVDRSIMEVEYGYAK